MRPTGPLAATGRLSSSVAFTAGGHTGTQARATYTCVGDTVNLAGRLEAHTKEVPHDVLIDGATLDGGHDDVAVTFVGPVVFRGKSVAVDVHAVARRAR